MRKDRTSAKPVGGRVLWFGLGAIFQLLVVLILGLLIVQDDELSTVVVSAVSAFSSLGLLAVAIWAGVVGVRTMRASQAASRAAEDASIEAKKSNVLAAAANRATEESNRQSKIDSKNANRPYVGASIVPGIRGDTTFDLMIRNYGQSIAKNVTVDLHEDPKTKDVVVRSLVEMFDTPRSFMPTQSLRVMWRSVPSAGKKFAADGDDAENGTHRDNELGMPESAHLTVKYEDAEGDRYEETFEVMSNRSGLWPVPEIGETDPANLTPKHFYRLGQIIAKHIGLNRY